MENKKISMQDEQMDQVTGGTILPYRVKPGDSLEKIARKYHVTVEQLRKWNNLPEGDLLKPDQLLRIKF